MSDKQKADDLPDRDRRPGQSYVHTRQEQHASEGLRLLDPELAALYERGLALARELDEHGAGRLLAFIGRELSRGVLRRVLEDENLAFSDDEFERLPKEGRNRASISRALHLPPEDPRVDDWFRLPGLFASWEKYDNAPPPPSEIRAAFARLGSLLYGRVAPYYATEADLDALIRLDEPTEDDATRLKDLLLRPGQRHYFFERLNNPAWMPLLTTAGIFRTPPGRRQNADGSWRATPWPEGDYIARAASAAPEAVVTAINEVPVDNDNPAVWDALARGAAELPSELAAAVVPHLLSGLVSGSAGFAAENVAVVAVKLAQAGCAEAFEVADYLLYVVRATDLSDVENLRYRSRTDWVFPRLGWRDKSETMSRLVAGLASSSADQTLPLLLSKLRRVQRLAESTGLRLWWRLDRSERAGRGGLQDVVALLVDLTVQVAEGIAERGAADARSVLDLVEQDGDFFRTVKYRVLEQIGHLLPERLDEILASSVARAPAFPATDVAALLRAQFRNASEGARNAFVHAVSEGQDLAVRRETLRRWHGREPTDLEVAEDVRHSQQRILSFFRGAIPEDFRVLAEELGVWGKTPSFREQQLAEVGSYSEAGSWGGAGADTVGAEELGRWSVDDVLDLVSSPSGGGGHLHSDLAGFARHHSGRALEVLERAAEQSVHPVAMEGLLNGLAEAVNASEELDWSRVIFGIKAVLGQGARFDVAQTTNRSAWRRTVGRACRLLHDATRADAIPGELASEVWTILRQAVGLPLVWDIDDPERGRTIGDIVVAELNDAAGDVSNATLSAALWHFRSVSRQPGGSRAEAQEAVGRELTPILDRWLRGTGPHAAVARAVIGDYWPQVHLLVPGWAVEHSAGLFDGGLVDPASRPTWTTYVSRSGVYDQVFTSARPWYRKAVEASEVWEKAVGPGVGVREVTERLAQHLLTALLRGLVQVGDEDGLLETAFDNLTPDDWSHAYWTVFRGWSDAEEPVPPSFVERLVGLWDWRVAELALRDPSIAVDEAKALGWLFHTPFIPVADLIRLGAETARLANGQLEMYSRWDRMLDLARADVDGAFLIVESVLYSQARAEYPHVPVDDVRPVLEHVLRTGSTATKHRARRLVNQLGERGFRQFRDLLA